MLFMVFYGGVAAGAEFQFNFFTGESYNYVYQARSTSKSSVFGSNTTKEQKAAPRAFEVKCVAVQNDAFILDIKEDNCTVRRYLKKNGELKGSPSELRSELPFFITLPEGNWEVGARHSQKTTFNINNIECPALWHLHFKEMDEKTSLATIDFTAQISLPQDSNRQKSFKFEGRLWFNVLEGCLTKANWATKYRLNLSNKEIAVVRALWAIEIDVWHSLELRGKGAANEKG
jgi:hypothetical protein